MQSQTNIHRREKKVVDGRRKSEEGEGEGSPFAVTI